MPRVSLGRFPTPVEHATALGERLGIASLWIKRDDLASDAYGGGKARKLERYLGDAVRQGKTRVATFGGVGSNQTLATTIHAHALGLRVTIFLVPEPRTPEVARHLLAMASLGADLRLGTIRSESDPDLHMGEETYVIPPGGSSPLGNLAFVDAALELADQVDAGVLPAPDVVYLPMGTMGSAAGLALGLSAAGLPTRVVAVRASNPGTSSEAKLARMLAETADFLDLQTDPAPIHIAPDQLGSGYAIPTPRAEAAIALAREAGLSLEPTYTGKALAALVADAPSLAGQTVLFWNTHHGRPLPEPTATPADLPPPLRPYCRGFAAPRPT